MENNLEKQTQEFLKELGYKPSRFSRIKSRLIKHPKIGITIVLLLTLSITFISLRPLSKTVSNDIPLSLSSLSLYNLLIQKFPTETRDGPNFVVEKKDVLGRATSYTVENKDSASQGPTSRGYVAKSVYAQTTQLTQAVSNSTYTSVPADYSKPLTYNKNGHTLSLTPLKSKETGTEVYKNTLVFTEIEPSTNVIMQALNFGIKEHIILKNSNAPREFRWLANYSEELETAIRRDGSIGFFKKGFAQKQKELEKEKLSISTEHWQDWRIFQIPAPYVVDSSGQRSHNVEMSFKDNVLTISIDPEFMAKAVYPVLLDPTVIDDTTTEFAITNNSVISSVMNRITDTGSGASPVLESYYQETPADINTVGLWHMNENAANTCTGGVNDVCDATSNANNGAFNGNATHTTSSRLGASAVTFDGTGDYIAFASGAGVSLDIIGNLSISAWIKTTDTSGCVVCFGNTASGATGYLYDIGSSASGKASFHGSGGSWVGGNTAVNDGNWHHIAVVISGTTASFYLDGVFDGSGTVSAPASHSGTRNIGTSADLNGILDEIMVSNTTRSADDIRQAFEISKRTHPITIDFVSAPQAAYTSGTSITINNNSGQTNLSDSLKLGDTLIVQENVGGIEYRSTGTVTVIANTSAVYGTVTLAAALSSLPSGGYTTSAKVFKWQREYWDLSGITLRGTHDNAITRLTVRVTDGSQGANVWIDDIKSNTAYLTTPGGSTITSTSAQFVQYRAIFSSADPAVSANLTSVTLDYSTGPTSCVIDDSGKNSSAIVKWADNSTNEDLYRVQRSVNAGAFANLTTTAADATSYTDSTTSAGNTYQYRVRAETNAGALSSYCTTETVSYQTGNFQFEGVQMEGVRIN